MKQLIENMTGGYSSSASVVDNNLIISLPDAKSPVIWRKDIGKIASAALEVREEKDGSYVLTFKHEKGQDEDIAPFNSRAKAVKALMTISSAMQNATISAPRDAANNSKAAAPVAALPQNNPKSEKSPWVGGLIGLAILAFLVYVLLTMSPGTPIRGDGAAEPQASAFATSTTNNPPPQDTGVPVSAETFLMGR